MESKIQNYSGQLVVNSISVIIPCYNRETLLAQTLRSLLSQTVEAVEIIVVDDGSTDGSANVAESFGSPVRVIRQANAGPAAARNRGFRESTGEFLHFFDSDDVALPNKHEVQLQAIQESGGDIAYGPWVKGCINSSGFTPENQVLQQRGLPEGDLIKALLTDWSIVPHACLFRRSMVERIGGFPEELYVAEDQLMFLRCLLAGAKVVHSPGTLELYRTNDAGKITASHDSAKARHHREWARFLIKARDECHAQGIDAASWFGFRRRAWKAERDLGFSALVDEELIQQLRTIHSVTWPPSMYSALSAMQRKWEGLKARVTGARGHRSFRMGKITAEQQLQIQGIFSRP